MPARLSPVRALTTDSVGDISFAGSLAKGNIEHKLVAYNSGNGIDIADVTITNITGHALIGFVNTAQTGVTVSAIDIVDIRAPPPTTTCRSAT